MVGGGGGGATSDSSKICFKVSNSDSNFSLTLIIDCKDMNLRCVRSCLASHDALEVMRVTYLLTESLTESLSDR